MVSAALADAMQTAALFYASQQELRAVSEKLDKATNQYATFQQKLLHHKCPHAEARRRAIVQIAASLFTIADILAMAEKENQESTQTVQKTTQVVKDAFANYGKFHEAQLLINSKKQAKKANQQDEEKDVYEKLRKQFDDAEICQDCGLKMEEEKQEK